MNTPENPSQESAPFIAVAHEAGTEARAATNGVAVSLLSGVNASGQPFSWGTKLSFQDLSGKELAFISQKLLSWKPRYKIHRGGYMFADVVKEFSWFSKKFTLEVPGPNDYSIDGSFWQHEYKFVRGGQQVAAVSKEYFSGPTHTGLISSTAKLTPRSLLQCL